MTSSEMKGCAPRVITVWSPGFSRFFPSHIRSIEILRKRVRAVHTAPAEAGTPNS